MLLVYDSHAYIIVYDSHAYICTVGLASLTNNQNGVFFCSCRITKRKCSLQSSKEPQCWRRKYQRVYQNQQLSSDLQRDSSGFCCSDLSSSFIFWGALLFRGGF